MKNSYPMFDDPGKRQPHQASENPHSHGQRGIINQEKECNTMLSS